MKTNAARILDRLGILERCVLKINSLGDPECRSVYRRVLVDYYNGHLARLSEEPTRTLRMSELAVLTNASLSRLSHLVTRLERWGFVRREPDSTDGRYTNAILTKVGYDKLLDSAPAHVEAVRQLVIDGFSPAELDKLRAFCERIVALVDASVWKQPLT